MARTIGKVKIRKLKAIISEEIKKATNPFGEVNWVKAETRVRERIPSDWYDTWESAWSEIDRIINDEVMGYVHGRR